MLRWKRLKRGLKSQNFLRGDNMYLLGEAGKRFVFFEDTYLDYNGNIVRVHKKLDERG